MSNTAVTPPDRPTIPLDERTYIVTGAGGGIGGAAVARLLRAGSNVVGVDLSSRRLAGTVEATRDLPGTLRTVKVDVTSESGAAEAIDFALSQFGSVQGVANVAGGMVNINRDVYDVPLESISLDGWQQMYALNINSAFLMCRALEKHFIAQGYGKIVNVASLAAFANRLELGNAAYNSAKAAVVAFTQSVSMQLGRQGVRANCIAPGLVLSDRVRQWIDDGYLNRHLAYTALGDVARPDDLGEGIAFFLEPQSDAITGETLRVAAGVR
ncbi:SDR family oxidoreductase [Amycolatopsis sp.]|uniref:SDR family NAD(P)-dependent oxidoreductase n=1 Tax=Amycolatopsis sp. TaxID=37632 RepID=UPI002BAA2456|nr:SDR family oxidoreductase [Amycolatopsis sp.]HVV09310.1 SDR family oxidoreductase [Amycolatopsis sp.]